MAYYFLNSDACRVTYRRRARGDIIYKKFVPIVFVRLADFALIRWGSISYMGLLVKVG